MYLSISARPSLSVYRLSPYLSCGIAPSISAVVIAVVHRRSFEERRGDKIKRHRGTRRFKFAMHATIDGGR